MFKREILHPFPPSQSSHPELLSLYIYCNRNVDSHYFVILWLNHDKPILKEPEYQEKPLSNPKSLVTFSHASNPIQNQAVVKCSMLASSHQQRLRPIPSLMQLSHMPSTRFQNQAVVRDSKQSPTSP